MCGKTAEFGCGCGTESRAGIGTRYSKKKNTVGWLSNVVSFHFALVSRNGLWKRRNKQSKANESVSATNLAALLPPPSPALLFFFVYFFFSISTAWRRPRPDPPPPWHHAVLQRRRGRRLRVPP